MLLLIWEEKGLDSDVLFTYRQEQGCDTGYIYIYISNITAVSLQLKMGLLLKQLPGGNPGPLCFCAPELLSSSSNEGALGYCALISLVRRPSCWWQWASALREGDAVRPPPRPRAVTGTAGSCGAFQYWPIDETFISGGSKGPQWSRGRHRRCRWSSQEAS